MKTKPMNIAKHNRAKRAETPLHGVAQENDDRFTPHHGTRHTATAAHWLRIRRALLFVTHGKGARHAR